MKTPGYMSYNRYKKDKENNSQKAIIIFVSTFFIMLLVFTAVAKHLSPDVDVTIGEETNAVAKESGMGVKRFIDDRLKMIQMEDNLAGASKKTPEKDDVVTSEESTFAPELDEKVRVPKLITDKGVKELDTTGNPRKAEVEKELSTPITTTSPSKVVVGYYTTIEQAKVAQGILMDAGLNVTPFIKDLGGSYTLQVGSYSTRAKAESVVSELLRNNFPARIIQD